jgi:tetratricopeptide (TPR) repeat protein
MLAGELPFTGDSPLALLYTIANEDPKPLRAARPDVPEAVEALVKRMLEKDPETRPDAATVARELAALTGASPPPGAGDTIELDVKRVAPAPSSAAAPDALVLAGARELVPEARPRRRWNAVSLFILLGGAVLLAFVLVLFASRQRSAPDREKAVALNNRGFELMQKDSLDLARTELEAAVRADGGYAEAMLNLGRLLARTGDDNRAAALFGRVLREHPTERTLAGTAHDGLAEIDMRSGAWPSAIDHLTAALALDSLTAPGYYNNLAFALIRAGRTHEAEDVLRRGLRHFPGVAALYKNSGLADFERGNYARALGSINRALSLDPSLAEARALRARANARLGHLDDARADQARLVALNPSRTFLDDVEADIVRAGGRK